MAVVAEYYQASAECHPNGSMAPCRKGLRGKLAHVLCITCCKQINTKSNIKENKETVHHG
jgi:hypothetical protein